VNSIFEGISKATELIVTLDAELLQIILLSLQVSGTALVIATVLAIPTAGLLGLKRFRGRGACISVLNTFMGLPPGVVGLFVYLLLSRSGPMGFLALLYSPTAMIIAQIILSYPIVASLCHTAIVSVDPIVKQASMMLGATQLQVSLTVINEARYGIMSAVIAARS
jgi:tungstate transport system permease protein